METKPGPDVEQQDEDDNRENKEGTEDEGTLEMLLSAPNSTSNVFLHLDRIKSFTQYTIALPQSLVL